MTMRRYEVVYVLAPTLTQEEVDQYAETYSEAAREHGAEIINVDKWEKRKLAFRVKKFWEGYYTILTLEEEAADAVTELERRFKVNDTVIRFLTVRIDEELKRAEKFRKEDEEDETPAVPEVKKAVTEETEKKEAVTKKAATKKAEDKEVESEEAEEKETEKKPAKKTKPAEKTEEPAAKEENPAEADSTEKAEEKPVEKPEEEK